MWFHVTSVRNRASIEAHGLDWSLMGAAAGIAGSAEPEVAGCFVCSADDVDFFVRINNTGGAAAAGEHRSPARRDGGPGSD